MFKLKDLKCELIYDFIFFKKISQMFVYFGLLTKKKWHERERVANGGMTAQKFVYIICCPIGCYT